MIKIKTLAKKLNLTASLYGDYMAKVEPVNNPRGNLILVTAINPTKFGEGKTTISIGLADALNRLNKSVCLALREPSLGPVFGVKGGAVGGGKSVIVPSEEINLHFTGDFHAITSANNLLCACVDNHIFQGNELGIDRVIFNRCLDMNDRALRSVNLGGREENFVITAASEIMAIMCVAENEADLRERLGNIIVGFTAENKSVYCKDLNVQGAMAVLLKQALKPNLVQTSEGTPALVHMGPFANIAHGCNSILATQTAMSVADYAVTEAGFGADLGAEKFLDFVCQTKGIFPNCAVIVATVRALKKDGELDLSNLITHIENLKNVYNLPCVVALNKFGDDSENDIAEIKAAVTKLGAAFSICTNFVDGGAGAIDLANQVIKQCKKVKPKFAYDVADSTKNKIQAIATKIYRAKGVNYTKKAEKDIQLIEKLNLKYPVIIAKTQYVLGDDAKCTSKDYFINVDEVKICNGAKTIVAVCGKMMLMPGLPKHPRAEDF